MDRIPPLESHLEFTTSNFSYITFFRRARRLNSASISLTSPTLLVSSAYLAFLLSLVQNSFFLLLLALNRSLGTLLRSQHPFES